MIDSVLAQSYSNWEMIIVDNHSDDDTDQIIKKYHDKRIKTIKINNGGVIAASRNRGIQESKGEWIAFLDSDDVWFQHKLERCMSIADQADLIYHDMKIYKADEELILDYGLTSRKLSPPVFKDLLIGGNTLINSSVVVRKLLLNQVGRLDEDNEMITAEDYHLWLKIAQKTDRLVHIADQLGIYTIHGQGLSQRDTTKQLRKAVAIFIPTLSKNEQKQVESSIRYSGIRTAIHTKQSGTNMHDCLYCILYGTFSIKIKAMYSLFQLFFK
ncbi:MAG: glycosyltransferase [Hydrotalea sp.]|nr:glycosyltransferase [Hydrotalea sp.]